MVSVDSSKDGAFIKSYFRKKEVEEISDDYIELVSQLYDKGSRNKSYRSDIDRKLQDNFLKAESDIREKYIEKLRLELRKYWYNNEANYSEYYMTCIRELLVWCLEYN